MKARCVHGQKEMLWADWVDGRKTRGRTKGVYGGSQVLGLNSDGERLGHSREKAFILFTQFNMVGKAWWQEQKGERGQEKGWPTKPQGHFLETYFQQGFTS